MPLFPQGGRGREQEVSLGSSPCWPEAWAAVGCSWQGAGRGRRRWTHQTLADMQQGQAEGVKATGNLESPVGLLRDLDRLGLAAAPIYRQEA